MTRPFYGIIGLLALTTVSLGLNLPAAKQEKNQTAGTNNGVMIQNNITTVTPKVDPSVEQALKEIAKQDSGDERGWLGILTRLTIPLPQTTAIYPITLLH